MSEVKIVGDVNVKQARGAGTAIMLVFFGLPLIIWWLVLAVAWIIWLPIAAITTVFAHGFFTRTWYYPWPAWMLGIR
jgi:hypothetical protein